MPASRRKFVAWLTAGATLPVWGRAASLSPAPQAAAVGGGLDPAALEFWTQHYGQPGVRTLGPNQANDRTPRFFIHTSAAGFRLPTSPPIQPQELAKDENLQLSLQVLAFKPSNEDAKQFDASQSGTLRVDVQQGVAASGAAQTKSWTAIAGLAAGGNQKLQPTSVSQVNLGSPWGDPQSLVLPKGAGAITWAFFLTRQEATWHKVLAAAVRATDISSHFLPLLSLAAATQKEWNNFNAAIGAVMPAPNATSASAQATWLLSPSTSYVAASQSAFQVEPYADGLPLLNGHYLVVPQAHYEAFGNAMGQMELNQGYVVPKGTPGQSVFRVAYDTPALQNVSYLCVACSVAAAPVSPCAAKA